jgi:hypothetical protein
VLPAVRLACALSRSALNAGGLVGCASALRARPALRLDWLRAVLYYGAQLVHAHEMKPGQLVSFVFCARTRTGCG